MFSEQIFFQQKYFFKIGTVLHEDIIFIALLLLHYYWFSIISLCFSEELPLGKR